MRPVALLVSMPSAEFVAVNAFGRNASAGQRIELLVQRLMAGVYARVAECVPVVVECQRHVPAKSWNVVEGRVIDVHS